MSLFGDLTKAVGGMLGGSAGGSLGATIGATLGSIVPGAGTVVGGMLGSAVGSALGAELGSTFGGVAGKEAENILFGDGQRSALRDVIDGSGFPLSDVAGGIFDTLGRNAGKVADALGDNVAGGIRGLGDVRDALLDSAAGGIRGVSDIRDAIFDRMEGAIRDFGRGGLPFLDGPAQAWPFPNIQPPRLPFVPVGPGQVATPTLPGGQDGLATNGRDVIDTGRYLVQVKNDGVRIYDKETNTWTNAADGRLRTGDGDSARFDNNLTFQLEDGTKVTLKMGPDGDAQAVAVMKGEQAVVVRGLDDNRPGVRMGNVLNNADFVDSRFADGTRLVAGQQMDDLTFASNGREIIGRFGDIDGPRLSRPPFDDGGWIPGPTPGIDAPPVGNSGGTPAPDNSGGKPGVGGSGGVGNDFGFEPGDTLIDKLFKILAKLEEKLNGQVEKLGQVKEGDQSGLQKAMFEIQKLQNQMKQIFETITNVQKSNDDTKEAIIRNFA